MIELDKNNFNYRVIFQYLAEMYRSMCLVILI
jgi:hypothetical protein